MKPNTTYPEAVLAVGLALASAIAYGVSDFLGGIFAKSMSPWRVAATGQFSSTICMTVIAGFVGGQASGVDIGWSVLAGLGSGTGAAFLYRGLAVGRMNVVAPISAIGTALIPVGVGLAAGDRPSALALVGIGLAFPAIWFVSRSLDEYPNAREGVADGVLSGVGFGLMFTALGQVSSGVGLWPLVALYITSTLSVSTIALLGGHSLIPRQRADLKPLLLGFIGAPAALAFFLATGYGMLSIVAAVTALFPATTVLLAAVVLHERVRAHQGFGLVLAALAVVCIATG